MAYNEAANKSAQEYKRKNIKRVPLDMQNAEYEKIKAVATEQGEKVNEFIKRAIRMRVEILAVSKIVTGEQNGEELTAPGGGSGIQDGNASKT